MYYTGLDPFTMKKVYVSTDYEEKKMQRALLQWNRKENHETIRIALRKTGRPDLIGFGEDCLVPPERTGKPNTTGKGNSMHSISRPAQGQMKPHGKYSKKS